jgi:hypothetical protein
MNSQMSFEYTTILAQYFNNDIVQLIGCIGFSNKRKVEYFIYGDFPMCKKTIEEINMMNIDPDNKRKLTGYLIYTSTMNELHTSLLSIIPNMEFYHDYIVEGRAYVGDEKYVMENINLVSTGHLKWIAYSAALSKNLILVNHIAEYGKKCNVRICSDIFAQLQRGAVIKHNIPMMKFIQNICVVEWQDHICACKDVKTLVWIFRQYNPVEPHMMYEAIKVAYRTGNADMIAFVNAAAPDNVGEEMKIYTHSIKDYKSERFMKKYGREIADLAAECGDYKKYKYLVGRHAKDIRTHLDMACEFGHFEIVDLIVQNMKS